MKVIPTKDGQIATWSEGEGLPVIFLHGGPGDTHHYMKRMAAPLQKKFQCIFFDQRGTGQSLLKPTASFDVPALLEDLLSVLDAYGLETAKLVGHSWGAMYALYASIEYPAIFTQAALLNMGPLDELFAEQSAKNTVKSFSKTDSLRWKILRSEREKKIAAKDVAGVQEVDRELMKLRVASWIFEPKLRADFLEDYFQDPPPNRDVNRAIWEAQKKWFSWEKLQDCSSRLWFCVGANDSVPFEQFKKIQAQVWTSSLSVYEECGHIPWIEHPQKFYQDLDAFLMSEAD